MPKRRLGNGGLLILTLVGPSMPKRFLGNGGLTAITARSTSASYTGNPVTSGATKN